MSLSENIASMYGWAGCVPAPRNPSPLALPAGQSSAMTAAIWARLASGSSVLSCLVFAVSSIISSSWFATDSSGYRSAVEARNGELALRELLADTRALSESAQVLGVARAHSLQLLVGAEQVGVADLH